MAETKIPEGPWTVEKLGEPLYCKLANEHGIFNPTMEAASYRPPLDLVEAYKTQNQTKPSQGEKPKE